MTTTDTDALTERIAKTLFEKDETDITWDATLDFPAMRIQYMDDAAAVLPIVAEEVRKAKAEALREAAREFALSPFISYSGQHVQERLHSRADRTGTGGSDEHR